VRGQSVRGQTGRDSWNDVQRLGGGGDTRIPGRIVIATTLCRRRGERSLGRRVPCSGHPLLGISLDWGCKVSGLHSCHQYLIQNTATNQPNRLTQLEAIFRQVHQQTVSTVHSASIDRQTLIITLLNTLNTLNMQQAHMIPKGRKSCNMPSRQPNGAVAARQKVPV
jgi:hypothetical protein